MTEKEIASNITFQFPLSRQAQMTTKGLPFVSLLTEICGYIRILFVSVLAVMYGTVEEAERHCHGNTPLSQPVKLSPILQQVMRF